MVYAQVTYNVVTTNIFIAPTDIVGNKFRGNIYILAHNLRLVADHVIFTIVKQNFQVLHHNPKKKFISRYSLFIIL